MMRERQYGGKGSEMWDARVHIRWHITACTRTNKESDRVPFSMEIVVIAWRGTGIEGSIRWYPVVD